MNTLTVALLYQVLRYEPETGKFFWLKGNNQKKVGDQAGYVTNKGYRRIEIGGHSHGAHRLAWLYVTGSWPEDEIDHINLDKDDNRFINLRPASHINNSANRQTMKTNVLQAKGIRKNPSGTYAARITREGKTHHLGSFDTIEEASDVYAKAAKQHFGEFARAE